MRQKTPEEEELGKKLSELSGLEAELAEVELELATLQAELQAFEIRYLKVVGSKMAKLDDIVAFIAEFFAQQSPADSAAAQKAHQARAQAKESSRAYGAADAKSPDLAVFRPSASLKSLYKDAAKRVHPDLGTDEKDRERRTRMMAEINDAYRSGDEERIRKILLEWEASPEGIAGEDVAAKLVRTIRKIAQVQRRLSDAKSVTNKLRDSGIFRLMKEVMDAMAEHRDLLAEMVERLEKEIAEQQTKLDQLRAAHEHR